MLLPLSTEPLVWDRASCDHIRPQDPCEEASSKLSDPFPSSLWPACRQLAPAEPVEGSARGWLCTGPRDCRRCTSSNIAVQLPSLGSMSAGTSRRMCLSQLSSRTNQLEHSHSVTSAMLEEPSMKYVTVENIFVTSCWQSGFSTRIRTDAKTLAFLLSSPFPSRTRLEYGKLALQLTL